MAEENKSRLPIVISGSYRKNIELLKGDYDTLQSLGCHILSPKNLTVVKEIQGFVFMKGEEDYPPRFIQEKHMEAMQRAAFVWLHAPYGYVGSTASAEIGFAWANGIPVYTKWTLKEERLRNLVKEEWSIQRAVNSFTPESPRKLRALKSFQEYYKRVAAERGYANESAQDCLLLMLEELGELARAVRKMEDLTRHHKFFVRPDGKEALELADVFLYILHLANIVGLNLPQAVYNQLIKEVKREQKGRLIP